MILVDTSELRRPTQRKLHAAWQELHGRQVLATPSVANELAPLAAVVAWSGESPAEAALQQPSLSTRRREELLRQAWWGDVWADTSSPYGIVRLTPRQEDLALELRTVIDSRCFPNTQPEYIPDLPDAAIVTESMVLGAQLLLTSNLQTIDHVEVNRWVVEHGAEWGLPADEIIRDADLAFVEWSKEPEDLERWVQAGLLACWPADDGAPAWDVIDSTRDGIRRMTHGDGGKLRQAGARLLNGLQKHSDPEALVERTRGLLPSPTIETDRRHPTYPHAA